MNYEQLKDGRRINILECKTGCSEVNITARCRPNRNHAKILAGSTSRGRMETLIKRLRPAGVVWACKQTGLSATT